MKIHPNPLIHEAAKLPHVVVCCCHQKRLGLTEKHVERGVKDLLEAEGWAVFPVMAELLAGLRRARKGSLDLIAFERLRQFKLLHVSWWIEVKAGNRDLTPEQLAMIDRAPDFGARVIIVDEVGLLAHWIKARRTG